MFAEVITSIETRKLNKTFTYRIPSKLEKDVETGMCVIVPFGKGNKMIKAYVVNISNEANLPLIKLKEIESINMKSTSIDRKMLDFATMVKDYYYLPMASILKLMFLDKKGYRESYQDKDIIPTNKGMDVVAKLRKSKKKELLKLIIEKGAVNVDAAIEYGYELNCIRELLKQGFAVLEFRRTKALSVTLSSRQEEVYGQIRASLEQGEKQTFLLFGATGSGKTEIYFKAIEKTLKKGKQAIVLLPEINLTEQMLDRYEKAFPGNVVKWHSQIGYGEKRKAWDELNTRKKNIIIGPRSAIFTNMAEVGLIVVDEEHDTSYYQQNMPAYNGRDVALIRAEIENAVVLLGSATPAVESMEKVNEGKYKLLRLEEKFYGQEDPIVKLIDMAGELKFGNFSIISRDLKKEIRSTLEKGEKVLVFLNRRGFYNFLMCRDCGTVVKCPDCAIPMTYHEKEKSLICHYCGNSGPKPDFCPHCSSKRIRGIGIGTEQVVDMVGKMFPKYAVGRLDSDILGGKKEKKRILEDFKESGLDILIGTQIIAKGIDFPNVGLVGILLGDMSLNFPDYRAREWTFQLLMQVIGRTGRREKKGQVLLQTYRPFDIIYKEIAEFDFEGFYKSELAFRKKLDYPPFGVIFRLMFSSKDKDRLTKVIWDFYEVLSGYLKEDELYKPKASRIEKHKGLYRWQIVMKLKSQRLEEKEKDLRMLLSKFNDEDKGDIVFYIERNPSGML